MSPSLHFFLYLFIYIFKYIIIYVILVYIYIRIRKPNWWEKGLTYTPGLLWRNSFNLRAKVHGGCRLTFEEIAHDVKWRKPSSEENIVRSSYWLFLFKLRWVRRIWNFISNSFWKENCWYLSEASSAIVMISYICTDIIVSTADF